MAEIIDDIREYTNVTRKYLDVKLELLKTKAKIAASEVASSLLISVMMAILIGGALLILSLGVAETLGNRLGDKALAFYIVGTGYLVLSGIVFVVAKAYLKRYIQNEIIRKLEDKHE